MTKGIFRSTENTADERVVRVIDLLKAAGHTVTTSPINPANGSDPRWKDWYEQGWQTAIESNNVFLAIVTPGYDCSSWMVIEFETAWKANQASGRPRLYVYPFSNFAGLRPPRDDVKLEYRFPERFHPTETSVHRDRPPQW